MKKDPIEFMKNLQVSTLQRNSHQDLEWKFIPPGAPHMGGLWKAGVKSFKTHLRKLVPHINFTFEELAKILVRIEACLNSRPLSPTSDDPDDLATLTSGYLIANCWKRLRIISHNFCQRWKAEYLKQLDHRYK